jgi:signal transduction histidine kinase/CHASE3 domain sensor protein
MKFIYRQKFLTIAVIILIGNTLLGYALYNSGQKLLAAEKWVEHTKQVITQSTIIFSDSKDLKTHSRDYMLTEDIRFVKSIKAIAVKLFTDIDRLKTLTQDNTQQAKRVGSLHKYVQKSYAFAISIVTIRRQLGLPAAIALLTNKNDKYYSDAIEDTIQAIQRQEEALLMQRKEASLQTLKSFNEAYLLVFILMVSCTLILLSMLGHYLLQNKEKQRQSKALNSANAELTYQNDEKVKRADELVIAKKELSYQNGEKKKRAGELVIANKELFYQIGEKDKRAAELIIADEELLYQTGEKSKRAAELVIANKELVFQNGEKEKRAAELAIANIELSYQNKEKGDRADELAIANQELGYQNDQKEKRAAELIVANKELSYQNKEKEQRAIELAFANDELTFQSNVRKVAEINLLRSESRLKEAQAIAKIGNFEIDLVKEIQVWSDEMYHIFALNKIHTPPSKELYLSFIHPDDAEDFIESMNKSSKSFNAFAAEFRFIRDDGVLRYGYSEARFDWNEQKELIRIYGIVQDVTERKLADIERKKMVNDLLIRNNDLEQFAYIISHNLRAPIANIIGASTVLNDVNTSGEDRIILKRAITTSVMKLDDVVQDLNHILQVKSDISETKEVVNFTDMVEDIKASIGNLFSRGDVAIACDFSSFDQFFTVKSYLYSIFYNLITNSVKYCRADVPCNIQIQSRLSNNTMQLIFKDNGIGIDMAKYGQDIFGLYKRFHENTKGKGMGLYMVKTQVEILGGKISVKSEENIGSEFTIEFAVNDDSKVSA